MRFLIMLIAVLTISGCAANLPRNPAVIGMTAEQVRTQTERGNPWSVHQIVTAKGVSEQWVYRNAAGRQYLYFTNGKLTAIQN